MKFLWYVCSLTLLTSCLTERPGNRNFASTKPLAASSQSEISFSKTVYPITKKHCSSCHGSLTGGEGPYQFPDDNQEQHKIVLNKQLIDATDPSNSPLVQRIANSHNCWSNCEEDALEMEEAIKSWLPFVDLEMLAPEGYKTEELNFLSGNLLPAEDGQIAREMVFDVSNIIGSPTTLSVVIILNEEPVNGERSVYVQRITLNPTVADVVVRDVKVLVETRAVGANVFSFISDVISPTSPDSKKELSQGATGVIPIDENITDPRIQLVVKQLRTY